MSSIIAVSGTRRAIKELVDGTIRVQVDIDPSFRRAFLDLFPDIDMPIALAPLVPKSSIEPPLSEPVETVEAVRQPNALAQKLHRDGFFRSPRLWDRIEAMGFYTQAAHKAWIEAQPCLFEKEREVRHGSCSGDIVLHHVKSAATPAAGKGEHPQKPPHWYGVPLCAIGHHQNWVHASLGASREDKQALLEEAVDLTAGQMKVYMKAWLGISSLREITPALLADFERAIGL